jgi:hypothetical protein
MNFAGRPSANVPRARFRSTSLSPDTPVNPGRNSTHTARNVSLETASRARNEAPAFE